MPAYFTRKDASIIKRMAPNQGILKGWAIFLEDMFVESGFGNYDLRMRLNQLKLLLKTVIDFQMDINVHEGTWTKEKVVDYMTVRGFMTKAEAERRWNQQGSLVAAAVTVTEAGTTTFSAATPRLTYSAREEGEFVDVQLAFAVASVSARHALQDLTDASIEFAMGCKLGTSVLGMEKEDLERYLDDGVLEKYGVGLFATEEASAATIRESTYLEPGTTKAVLVAPLSFFKDDPHVVVFTANSEQVMWLLYAVNYDKGGRQDLPQSGGALGGCADITAFPLITGAANITFLGLGCRIKAAVDPCHLMLGIPENALPGLHAHIMDLAKPIAMLKKACR